MSKLTVTVLMGGPDAEREISIQSGIAVSKALEQSDRFVVTPVLISQITTEELRAMQTDVIFPVLHGPFGEGGPLQELLEQAGVPFVGSGSIASANAMDKEMTKEIASSVGISTPNWTTLTKDQPCTLKPPLVLKPLNEGSSIDVVICNDTLEVATARERLHVNRNTLLAETFIQGREITVGIIDGNPLPIVEIIPSKEVRTYDYEAKYERNDTQFILKPELPPNDCVDSALLLYQTMHIQDIARVDFIIDNSKSWLLELNTMPGFTDHSLVPMAANSAGVDMVDLCSSLVELAALRVIK